jgi:hypothetical protein
MLLWLFHTHCRLKSAVILLVLIYEVWEQMQHLCMSWNPEKTMQSTCTRGTADCTAQRPTSNMWQPRPASRSTTFNSVLLTWLHRLRFAAQLLGIPSTQQQHLTTVM